MTTPQDPAMGVSVGTAKIAIEARNKWLHEHDGDAVGGMQAALLAALPHMQPAGEAVNYARLNAMVKAKDALESARNWHLGDKYRFGDDAERMAWQTQLDLYDGAIAAFTNATPPQPSAEEAQGAVATSDAVKALQGIVERCMANERHPRMTDYWRPAFVTIRNMACGGLVVGTTPPAPVDVRLREAAVLVVSDAMPAKMGRGLVVQRHRIDALKAALLSAQPSADAGDGELAALRSFAQDVMEAWPLYDVDGGTLQDAAERHGLLIASKRTVPCGEDCACSEFCTEGETTHCYQRTELLTGAAIAAQREAGEG